MARIHTAGFETNRIHSSFVFNSESNMDNDALAMDQAAVGTTVGTTISIQNSVARNGGYALQCNPSAANYTQLRDFDHTLAQPVYARFYFRTNDATPSTALQIWVWRLNGLTAADIVLNTGGKFLIRNAGAASTIGTSAMTAANNTWYRIETHLIVNSGGTGETSLLITNESDGSSETVFMGSALTGTAVTPITHRCGHITPGETTSTVYIDDIAVNDHTGTEQNTYPGPGNITFLKPVSDNAKGTGWVAGAGGTTNLYDAVDNVPPTGVVIGSAGNTTQIKNAASLGAASNYDANCQTPEAAGVPAGANIRVAQAVARLSSDSTTGTNLMSVQSVTPASAATRTDAEVTAVAAADNSATVNTGWKNVQSPHMHSPAMTSATTPVVRVIKTELGVTRNHMADLMGLIVEWTPTDQTIVNKQPKLPPPKADRP